MISAVQARRLMALPLLGLTLAALASPAASQVTLPQSELSYILSATVTSDYVTSGVSQSGGNPSFQPFFELDWRGFYGGVALSYVQVQRSRTEFDLYFGHRRRLENGMFFDVSYRRFWLNDSGYCCGEARARVIFPIAESFGAELLLAYNHTLESVNHRARLIWDAGDRWTAAAAFGETSSNDNQYWTVGAAYRIRNNFSLTARYEGAETGDPGLVLSLGWSNVTSDIARLLINPFQ